MKIPVIAIVGPTASGKTGLSIDLAKEFGGEIISADSMQIYKYMNIGTAKPSAEEMQGIPHFLLDFLEPDKQFSVAQYTAAAKECILDISSRGKLPFLVGGTGLYVSSLLENIEFAETGSSEEIRSYYMQMAAEKGNDFVFAKLSEIDPQCAAKLHSNNLGRVVRALELYELTGKNMTWHVQHSKLKPSPYAPVKIGLDYANRDILKNRINLRVDMMLKNGLLAEAEQLFSSEFSATAKQAIGYKELLPYFQGDATLEECAERIKISSRRYAKRQLTWFRRDSEINWIFPDTLPSYDAMYAQAKSLVEKSRTICYNE